MSDYQSLPDLESLAALANEFFKALPNAEPVVSGLSSTISSHVPQAFSQRPHANHNIANSGTQVPDLGAKDVPSLPVALKQQAAALPASHYYFAENFSDNLADDPAGKVSQYPFNNFPVEQLTTQASAKAFGLPSDEELKNLLMEDLLPDQKRRLNCGFLMHWKRMQATTTNH